MHVFHSGRKSEHWRKAMQARGEHSNSTQRPGTTEVWTWELLAVRPQCCPLGHRAAHWESKERRGENWDKQEWKGLDELMCLDQEVEELNEAQVVELWEREVWSRSWTPWLRDQMTDQHGKKNHWTEAELFVDIPISFGLTWTPGKWDARPAPWAPGGQTAARPCLSWPASSAGSAYASSRMMDYKVKTLWIIRRFSIKTRKTGLMYT